MASVMDFLHFNSQFQVLICPRCEYALVPGTIDSYLASLHKNKVTKCERRDCIEIEKNNALQPLAKGFALQVLLVGSFILCSAMPSMTWTVWSRISVCWSRRILESRIMRMKYEKERFKNSSGIPSWNSSPWPQWMSPSAQKDIRQIVSSPSLSQSSNRNQVQPLKNKPDPKGVRRGVACTHAFQFK